MKAPQIIIICLVGMKLLMTAYLHKKEKKEINFWNNLINITILIGLLIWGGFFK